jgi:hypothetical protein
MYIIMYVPPLIPPAKRGSSFDLLTDVRGYEIEGEPATLASFTPEMKSLEACLTTKGAWAMVGVV